MAIRHLKVMAYICQTFYSKLYKVYLVIAKTKDVGQHATTNIVKLLDEKIKISLMKRLILGKLKVTLGAMQRNKLPHPDGVIIEFYKYFET